MTRVLTFFAQPRVTATVILISGVLSAAAIVLGSTALSQLAGQAERTCREVGDLRSDLVFVLDQFEQRTASADYARFYNRAKHRIEPVRCP